MNGLLAWRGVGRVGLGVGGSGPPSPAQTHLHLSPGCGPREAGGSGRVWLHCSSPSCTLPGWPRAGGSSHTGPSQSHRKLQGSWAVSRAALAPSARGSPPLLEAGRHRAGTPGSHSRPQGPTWPRARPVLEEEVVQRDVGVLHPRGHSLEHHLGRRRARQARDWSGRPSGVSRAPPPALTLQARWACTSTVPRRQVSPPWPPTLSTCLLPASSTWTCKVPAPCGHQPGSAAVGDSARSGPHGQPGHWSPCGPRALPPGSPHLASGHSGGTRRSGRLAGPGACAPPR